MLNDKTEKNINLEKGRKKLEKPRQTSKIQANVSNS
jgi:hypothetical protein